jgi:hypothetical protein
MGNMHLTYHPQSLDDAGDRPAPEIEVTPAMIASADRALFESGLSMREGDSVGEAAIIIYRAMETARLASSADRPCESAEGDN